MSNDAAARRAKLIESQIARRVQLKQGVRAHATLEGGAIRQGRVISPDGLDMSHRFEVRPVRAQRKVRYMRDRSAMGEFAAENGGFVWGLFKSSVTMAARWADAGLSQSDFARLMYIGTYTDYEGVLRQSNGRPITKASMLTLVGIHRTKFDELYNKLTSACILRESPDGLIHMSSEIFQRGSITVGNYTDRTRLYRDTIRSLYDQYGKGRSVRQLGVVYSVIPFLHRNLNVLCYNPLESDDESVKTITLEKLALMLGYQSPAKFKQTLRSIEINGQPAFVFVEDPHDSRQRIIVVNPRVIFAGDYEGLMACRGLAVLFN